MVEVLHLDGSSVTLGNFVTKIWATFIEPLEDGVNKVIWKIVGAIGHPIEGEFSCTVDVPIEEILMKTKLRKIKSIK